MFEYEIQGDKNIMSELIILITLLIVLLMALGAVVYYFINEWLNINVRMAVYADMAASLKNESIFLNFVNVSKNIDFWNAHEADLKLYAMGTPIEAVFYRSPDVPNGYKIAYATSLSNIEVLSLIGAVKYNKFEVSWNGGATRVKVNSIKDSVAKKVSKKMQSMKTNSADFLKEEILKSISEADKQFYLEEKKAEGDRVISHINESKTTSTSVRFQAIIPPTHPMFKIGFNAGGPNTKFYYTYNNRCYEMNSIYLGQVENLYQWDFIDLEPNTIYAGLSFSINEQRVIIPSTSLYAITKEEGENNSRFPTIDDANLGKPKFKHEESYEMWSEKDALEYLGENLLRRLCDILIKKHHEDEFEDEYISLNNVEPFYEEHPWLSFGLKYKNFLKIF